MRDGWRKTRSPGRRWRRASKTCTCASQARRFVLHTPRTLCDVLQRSPRPLRVIAAVPTPPPWSGPEVNGARLLAEGLGPDIDLYHLRTTLGTRNEHKGAATLENVSAGI